MTERIRWEPTEYSGFVGYCTDDPSIADWMFQVWKTGTGKWQLDSTLPGQFGRHVYDDNDPGPLKAEAERWLAEFVTGLGAIFPEEPAKSRAWHAAWAMAGRDQDGNAILRHKPTGGLYRLHPVDEALSDG